MARDTFRLHPDGERCRVDHCTREHLWDAPHIKGVRKAAFDHFEVEPEAQLQEVMRVGRQRDRLVQALRHTGASYCTACGARGPSMADPCVARVAGLLHDLLTEADRVRGYLQTDFPKTAGGSLLLPGITGKERRELLYGVSIKVRTLLEGEDG